MRKGFRSSRGAMRGTNGGALIFVGVVGFATVAIGVGPFLLSYSLGSPTWPRFDLRSFLIIKGTLPSRSQQASWNERHTHRGRRWSRNVAIDRPRAWESKAFHPRTCRRPGRGPSGARLLEARKKRCPSRRVRAIGRSSEAANPTDAERATRPKKPRAAKTETE